VGFVIAHPCDSSVVNCQQKTRVTLVSPNLEPLIGVYGQIEV